MTSSTLLAMLCVLSWLSLPVSAQIVAPASAASDGHAPCVDVAINDHPALSYDCLNRRLTMAGTAPAQPSIDVDAVTRESGNRQVGQYNFSTLSHRMGTNLGHSVLPQRPPSPLRLPNTFPMLSGTH